AGRAGRVGAAGIGGVGPGPAGEGVVDDAAAGPGPAGGGRWGVGGDAEEFMPRACQVPASGAWADRRGRGGPSAGGAVIRGGPAGEGVVDDAAAGPVPAGGG